MNETAFYSIDTFTLACRLLGELGFNFEVKHLVDGSILIKHSNDNLCRMLENRGIDGSSYFNRI